MLRCFQKSFGDALSICGVIQDILQLHYEYMISNVEKY